MIDREKLLGDLQAVLKRIEADLLDRSESSEVPEVGQTLRSEYKRAKDAERTAQNFEDWRGDAVTQTAAAWVLSCVFVRFLEDNLLIDPPRIAGPDERLQRARDEHEIYFRKSPIETDREYLLTVFDDLARLPGAMDIFGKHNSIRELPTWLSGDAAGELLRFFQKIDADSGVLVHDFTDPDWDTRFLGNLYQDLSESARKKYALLQTPDFVEEFILDRTLDPALDEFGVDAPAIEQHYSQPSTPAGFRTIDPACGSGHFLLGAFPRILDRWQKKEPGGNIRDLVQRALDCIYGVDLNPYAVAISRFRLLLAAMQASGVKRLDDAPKFQIKVACGDSLLHGPDVAIQTTLEDMREDEHAYWAEDLALLRKILRNGHYHAVVANPPYITPKDRGLNQRYRSKYRSCHMKYSLSVPFMERIFRLAVGATDKNSAGFTGQITANSFMKREFGKKLIEEFLPQVDLTHVIDTSGAYIPSHGTPTVILFGRNRNPVSGKIRAAMGIRGEPSTPDNPALGLVWSSIVTQIDKPGSEDEFVSVGDSDRERFRLHPWSIGGGGAAELKERLDNTGCERLSDRRLSNGFGVIIGETEVFMSKRSAPGMRRLNTSFRRWLVVGEEVRDWGISPQCQVVFPYSESIQLSDDPEIHRYLWPFRRVLESRPDFSGKTYKECGRPYHEYHQIPPDRNKRQYNIAYANIATHNHFSLSETPQVFRETAPIITLDSDADTRSHMELLGILNSSIACFWLKQTCFPKGGHGIGRGIQDEAWESRFAFNAANIDGLPLPRKTPYELASRLHEMTRQVSCSLQFPSLLSESQDDGTLKSVLRQRTEQLQVVQGKMIQLQEELDWECYQLYGLIDERLIYDGESFPLELGQRAFEIVMARRVVAGKLSTTWFERHDSAPIAELPNHWPKEYRRLVQRRIELIERDPNLRLLEQPEYKRRWKTEPWRSQLESSAYEWLLDRLESYSDFDGRMGKECRPTSRLDIALISVTKLADVARQDANFMEVGEVYRDDPAFDVERLVAELVAPENVPLLPVLRYKPSGLRKKAEWEKTWELQRQEDAIEVRTKLPEDDPQYLTEDQAQDLKKREIGDIPVPPKYKSSDFISSGGARYWSLRGKLDVPKERWVSFPHCEGPDGTLVIAWAGYDHLQLARAISEYYVDIQERLGGRDDPRLVPLLACIIELLPWLKQWHHDIDPDFNQRMDEVFEGFVTEEAKALNMTIDEVKAWQPPKKAGSHKRKKAGT